MESGWLLEHGYHVVPNTSIFVCQWVFGWREGQDLGGYEPQLKSWGGGVLNFLYGFLPSMVWLLPCVTCRASLNHLGMYWLSGLHLWPELEFGRWPGHCLYEFLRWHSDTVLLGLWLWARYWLYCAWTSLVMEDCGKHLAWAQQWASHEKPYLSGSWPFVYLR